MPVPSLAFFTILLTNLLSDVNYGWSLIETNKSKKIIGFISGGEFLIDPRTFAAKKSRNPKLKRHLLQCSNPRLMINDDEVSEAIFLRRSKFESLLQLQFEKYIYES